MNPEEAPRDRSSGGRVPSLGAAPAWRILPQTIRGKLALALAVVAVATLVGGMIGQATYQNVEAKLGIITETSVPSLVAAQRIGELTAQIAAAAPALHGADSEATLSTQQKQVSAHLSELRAAVADLTALGRQMFNVSMLNLLADEAAAMLDTQTDNVRARLLLASQSRTNVESLTIEHLKFNTLIAPILETENAGFLEASSGVIETTKTSVKQLSDMSLKGLLPILVVRVQADKMLQALARANVTSDEAEIDAAWQVFVAANSTATSELIGLQGNELLGTLLDAAALEKAFSGLAALGIGDDNVFDRRRALVTADAGSPIATADDTAHAVDSDGALDETLATLDADLERTLKPMLTVIRGRTATSGIDLTRFVSETLTTLATDGLNGIADLQKLEALGNRIAGALTAAALLEDDQDLEQVGADFQASADQLEVILARHESNPALAPIARSAHKLVGFGRGEGDVFAVRATELQAIAQGRYVLERSLKLAEQMASTSAEIATATRASSTQAADEALASLVTSWWALVAAASAGIAAMLGVWLYVQRSLGARLSALSGSMRAIAGGNLGVQLPTVGRDEIGQMAEALSVFRDTAVEVEENNLREIATARQRLIDAIESTSEGFAFYDADDRLMLSNRRYHELLHGGGELDLTPGTPFEAIIRQAVGRGLIADAAGDPEGWIEERLERHRNPGEPQLQRRSNGRWVQVSERRIAGGGTVAVFSDLTELKESEQQAASANRLIMESLRYASRIQSAVLPARGALSWAVKEHFLIWEPRDVVGGDFFWFQPAEGGYVVIVGDCTGHGVPGAFMTLIACGMLDRIWQTVPPDQPSRVLGELHRGLQVLLGQDQGEGDTDDGLEAGVCYVSEAERRLVFAGARFSLWRANVGTVDEIKGDKAGIGYRRFGHDTRFNDVPVELADGAAFYLTTDGLIDQIGGPRHRSFGKRRFRAFVAGHHGRRMPEQAEALRQTLGAYQGEEVRRDDVTVLGFAPDAA